MYNVYVFNEISCTSIKFPFKMITVVVELKRYYNKKNVRKLGCFELRRGVGCQDGNIPV